MRMNRAALACLPLLGASVLAQPNCPDAGMVVGETKFSALEGGFQGDLDPGSNFGRSVAPIGDLDGDGVTDIAVGAHQDDDGGTDRGAVWVLFMNADGTVKAEQKISNTAGGMQGQIQDGDAFGTGVASLGDLDGDGVTDLAVGAQNDDDGGVNRGAVWVLFLNTDGTVKSPQKISSTAGGFQGQLDNVDRFGISVASLGDLDTDGATDIGVGAMRDDDGGTDRGAVWVLFLNTDGTVRAEQKISSTDGGFQGQLDNEDYFGISVATMSDLDGDGVAELGVGAYRDDDGGLDRGAVWVLFLNTNGTVRAEQKISSLAGGFLGQLHDSDRFGGGFTSVGDLDADGVSDIAVGAQLDDDGGTDRGAVWVLFMNADGTVKGEQKISGTAGGFQGHLDDGDTLGVGAAWLGDLDGDAHGELAVGAFGDDDGGTDAGAVWILSLKSCETPPEVVQQPESVLLSFPGGSADLEVMAAGDGQLTYQWRKDAEPLFNGGNISGADTPILTVVATSADEGLYDCIVTNPFGEATSNAAVLGIRPNPCPGDFDGNGTVNTLDVLAFLNAWSGGC